ncbi:hypothetical protein [Qipengyuania pacifica]|uniref:hypothetical protein n=1 Tax=Qipengyuania pacifica TaxID=2860199 RepID=UPI001C9DBD08|nr:hypothetical protein [Qipengyuania pacifica]MBY8333146.1 hypothetical protein [Qipengyuania pacifica]
MTDQVKQVCRREPQTKTNLSRALSAAWGRVSNALGKGTFADKAGFGDTVTINRALTGPSLPSSENLLNSLAADPNALEEVFALYGLDSPRPKNAQPANDMDLVTNLSGTVAEYLQRLADGKRCHVDTAVLAKLFRPLIPQMQAIVDEDAKRRAA